MSEKGKSRGFMVVLNNPTYTPVEFINKMKQYGVKRLVFQLERGEQNGTPHYQGFIYFRNPRYEKAVSKHLDYGASQQTTTGLYRRTARKTRPKRLVPGDTDLRNSVNRKKQ